MNEYNPHSTHASEIDVVDYCSINYIQNALMRSDFHFTEFLHVFTVRLRSNLDKAKMKHGSKFKANIFLYF